MIYRGLYLDPRIDVNGHGGKPNFSEKCVCWPPVPALSQLAVHKCQFFYGTFSPRIIPGMNVKVWGVKRWGVGGASRSARPPTRYEERQKKASELFAAVGTGMHRSRLKDNALTRRQPRNIRASQLELLSK